MRRAIQATPNHLLRLERELRGWSQKDVAEQIEAAPYYVSRWECGLTMPSPHFRRKLCVLFGKDAKALGLLGDEALCAEEEASQSVSVTDGTTTARNSDFIKSIHDSTLPLLPNVPGSLIGRDELLLRLKQSLCSETHLASATTVALNGLPGVGKSALAVALAYDEEVQERFCDGILWAGLVPQPDIEKILNHWSVLLHGQESDLAKSSGKEDMPGIVALAEAIHQTIGSRSFLIIIDDAWRIEDALACKVGGPNCAYLVTTRRPEVALLFAGQEILTVRELSEADGADLLAQLAPQACQAEPEETSKLVQLVGGLPLALVLMGNALRVQAYGQQPRRIRRAIARMYSAAFRLHLELPQGILESHPGLSDDVPLSLWSTIQKSAETLSPAEQQALCALSAFQARPATFAEEEALLAGIHGEELDALVDAGLLESDGAGRYALHATIADYARLQHGTCEMEAPEVSEACLVSFSHSTLS